MEVKSNIKGSVTKFERGFIDMEEQPESDSELITSCLF